MMNPVNILLQWSLSFFPSSTQPTTCDLLAKAFPSSVFTSNLNATAYTTTVQSYWDLASALRPDCVFAPSEAADVASAIKLFVDTSTLFAVKSGGHFSVPGFNSIDSPGVLISLERLTQLEFAKNDTVLQVGPGNVWGDVYSFADKKGRVVVGGRANGVGVGGLTLGGGLSLLGNEYGFVCDNVVGFQVALANGTIIYASHDNYNSDLYKALKGGGSNFGVVTRFDFATINLPIGWGGVNFVPLSGQGSNPDSRQKAIDAVTAYHLTGQKDVNSGIIMAFCKIPSYQMDSLYSNLFYSKPVTDTPKVFREIAGFPGSGGFGPTSMKKLIDQTMQQEGDGKGQMRNLFRTLTMRVTKEAIATAERIFHEEFAEAYTTIAGLSTTLVFQPISATFIDAAGRRGGNMMGLDASKAPYSIVCQSISWALPTDDDKVRSLSRTATAKTIEWIKAHGLYEEYLFMNDGDGDQDIIGSYGAQNKKYLIDVRNKYDPKMVFTTLFPGGYKLEMENSLYGKAKKGEAKMKGTKHDDEI